MSCPACARAENNPLAGMYSSGCDECKARAIANGRELFDAARKGEKTPEYNAALRKVFGDDPEMQARGHERVRAWAKRIKAQAVKGKP